MVIQLGLKVRSPTTPFTVLLHQLPDFDGTHCITGVQNS